MKNRYRLWYTLAGLLLGLGAPGGWLLYKLGPEGLLDGVAWGNDISAQPDLYWYMLISTSIVFALFGFVLGWREEVLANRNEQLQHMAVHDPLTSLFNRQYLSEMLEKQVAQSFRYGQPVSVIMADLDHFKKVNDEYGHQAGDYVLRSFALTLLDTIRDSDLAFRYGGEEFVVVLPETSLADARETAERIRQSVADMPLRWRTHTLNLTVSLGVTGGIMDAPSSGQVLIAEADRALYSAKQGGRNRVVGSSRKPPGPRPVPAEEEDHEAG